LLPVGCQIGQPDASMRAFASAAIARMSPPKRSEILRRTAWISSITGSVSGFWIIAKQLLGGADDRNGNTKVRQHLVDTPKYLRVRDVLAIPGQQVGYTVMCDGGDMD